MVGYSFSNKGYARGRRPYRRRPRAAVRKPYKKPGFWGSVARTALGAVRAAAEIKRALAFLDLSIVSNPIDSLGTPTAQVTLNGWYTTLFSWNLGQGSTQEARQGNKILVKAINGHIRVQNTNSSPATVRMIIWRMQRNYLTDTDPAASDPLPASMLGFPNYKDTVQILQDKLFTLSPINLEGASTAISFYKKLNQPQVFRDNTDGPEKGTLYISFKTDILGNPVNIDGTIQETFHDMM